MPKATVYKLVCGENGVLELQPSPENKLKSLPSANHSFINLFLPSSNALILPVYMQVNYSR